MTKPYDRTPIEQSLVAAQWKEDLKRITEALNRN